MKDSITVETRIAGTVRVSGAITFNGSNANARYTNIMS